MELANAATKSKDERKADRVDHNSETGDLIFNSGPDSPISFHRRSRLVRILITSNTIFHFIITDNEYIILTSSRLLCSITEIMIRL